MSVILNTAAERKDSLWLEISLEKLRNNCDHLRRLITPMAGMLAVVKANAYGHGLVPCAKALESRVEYFGVSDLDEAIQLREKGITKPILIFGFTGGEDVVRLLQYDLTASLPDISRTEELDRALSELPSNTRLKVHLKIDTGMGRLGIDHRSALGDILKLRKFSNLNFEGIFTHFAAADRTEAEFVDFTRQQLARFEKLLVQLEREDMAFRWRHAAGSGALLNFKDSHLNLVRPGLALYGLYEDPSRDLGFEEVLSWKTRVKLVKELEPGDTVSYNRRFKAERSTRVAVLPVGYSHGYPYSLTSKARVSIRGKSYPIAGQVCMDYTVIDLGPASPVEEGDEVTLIGPAGEEPITAGELACLAGTIPYEIVTRLNLNIPRFYTE